MSALLRNARFRIMGLLALLLQVGGASDLTAQGLPPARVQEKVQLLQTRCGERLSAATRQSIAETATVDVHSHTFNLGFLPLEEILYRYRLPEDVARPIAALLLRLTDKTPLAGPPRDDIADPMESFVGRLTPADLAELARQERALEKAAARDSSPAEVGFTEALEEAAQNDPALARLSPDDRRRVTLLLQVVDRAGRGEDSSESRREIAEMKLTEASPEAIAGRARGFLRMAALLTLREDRVVKKLEADFPVVDLFVHHMMDLDNVYHGASSFDLDERLRRVQQLGAIAGDRIRFSVAYDPFRRQGALEHVKAGIAAGAVAIKFYPPSGYRPSASPLPWKPTSGSSHFPWVYLPVSARSHQKTQWDWRYAPGIDVVRKRIDDLVALSLEKDVPIFSHHTPQGFEAMGEEGKARLNYGKLMADPIFWEPVLRLHPRLRLVLAHSGGGDSWFGGQAWEGSFDQHAYQLCVSYPNVYCDFGMSSEVLTSRGRSAFRRKLEELGALCSGAQCGQPGRPKYDIRDKLLYGSDWHMVSQIKRYQDLVCGFGEVLSGGALEGWAPAFFGDNARRAMRLQH